MTLAELRTAVDAAIAREGADARVWVGLEGLFAPDAKEDNWDVLAWFEDLPHSDGTDKPSDYA